jgi:hypothetical protein
MRVLLIGLPTLLRDIVCAALSPDATVDIVLTSIAERRQGRYRGPVDVVVIRSVTSAHTREYNDTFAKAARVIAVAADGGSLRVHVPGALPREVRGLTPERLRQVVLGFKGEDPYD